MRLTSLPASPAENYEAVAQAVFANLRLLLEAGPQPETFAEVKALADLSFKFAEKSSSPSDYASDVASNLSGPWPKEWTLSQAWLVREFDAEGVRKTLEGLTVDRCKLTVASQELPKSVAARGGYDKKEPIYGTEYRVERLSEEFVKQVNLLALVRSQVASLLTRYFRPLVLPGCNHPRSHSSRTEPVYP